MASFLIEVRERMTYKFKTGGSDGAFLTKYHGVVLNLKKRDNPHPAYSTAFSNYKSSFTENNWFNEFIN